MLLASCASFCYASDALRYVNSNYCFSVPQLQLGSEEPSQDGTGVTFSKEGGCAEAPIGSCDKISVYAEYAVNDEPSRKDWFKDIDSVYVESGWTVDARRVVQTDGTRWHLSIMSKVDAGRHVTAVTYQTLDSASGSPVIYAINGTFGDERASQMYADVGRLTRGFRHTSTCK
jgi:hypothetical protein